MGYYVVNDAIINVLIQNTFDQHAEDKKILYKFIKANFKTEEFYEGQHGVRAMKFKENPDPKVWKKSDIGSNAYTLKRVGKLNQAMHEEFQRLNKTIKLTEIVKALKYGEGTTGCYMVEGHISFNPGITKGKDGHYWLSTPDWVDGRWDISKLPNDAITEVTGYEYRCNTEKTVS